MYIYDKKNGGLLDVYSFEPKKEEIKEYKEHILKHSSKKDRFLFIRTNCYEKVSDSLRKKSIQINDIIFDEYDPLGPNAYSKLYSYSELFELDYSIIFNMKVALNRYINNLDEGKNVCVVNDLNNKKKNYYYISPSCFKKQSNYNRSNTINYILNLPSSLYTLYLLENGYFNELGNTNIDKQLELFNITKHSSIMISEAFKLLDIDLISNDEYNKIKSKISDSSKILQKIKK